MDYYDSKWLDNLPVLVKVSDVSASCVYVNRKWVEFTGYSLKQSSDDDWEKYIHEKDKENYFKKIKKAHIEKEEYSVEMRFMKNSYEFWWLLDCGKPLFDEFGMYVGHFSVCTDISESKKQERELLNRENQHRIRNTMSVVMSMLDLHSDYIFQENDKGVFTDCQNRISSIALAHGKFYSSNVLIKTYISELVARVKNSYFENKAEVIVKIEVDETELELEKAMPFGLIINELVTNAFKHAFDGSGGEIYIGFYASKENYILMVSDNGKGVPEEKQLTASSTLGYTLINALTRQLNATLEIVSNEGLKVQIRF
ncbi:MAG TPA: histidine kinase dimerization/phosphoacceptor domain -containing protein [Cytophagaceae bacterium]|jgi:PAS domain S-box-containing protein|nr:histidine kinase dimerization/phosphoacceptor domain -containing protein [Cytophagaceae bacterium]